MLFASKPPVAESKALRPAAAAERRRRLGPALAAAALAGSLAGCGTINEKLSTGMGDYVPQWAGGLPADAPPRPGSAKYDAYMQELERRRALPPAQREQIEKNDPASSPVR